jgi:hypothetical protein
MEDFSVWLKIVIYTIMGFSFLGVIVGLLQTFGVEVDCFWAAPTRRD